MVFRSRLLPPPTQDAAMDPTTTLVTFFLQTHPSVQSVNLVGSWDNFSSYYPMERDSRRGQGQWKGCHTFRGIICEDDSHTKPKRQGGLKMDSTYYYYYEVDGSNETFDSSRPATTTCPYLPGQKVNMINVPRERTLRTRSASLSSMRQFDFKTMDPESKYNAPRRKPVGSGGEAPPRMERKISASYLVRPTTARSNSPAPAWKRFFSHKLAKTEDDRGRSPERADRDDLSVDSLSIIDDNRSVTSSHRSRQRSISPESLRRFLSDDTPSRSCSRQGDLHPLVIPEEIFEDAEDDDNFAASAVSESLAPFQTSLSPPPFQRSGSLDTVPLTTANLSSLTLRADSPEIKAPFALKPAEVPQQVPALETTAQAQAGFGAANTSSGLTSPASPQFVEDEMLTFYDESNEDDDDVPFSCDGDDKRDTLRVSNFENYSLPQTSVVDNWKGELQPSFSLPKLAGSEPGSFSGTASNLLGAHIDSGLDDFVSELGWMVDTIGAKHL